MKGSPKRVTPVNFWIKYKEKVPENIKGLIYDQYYSKETMYVYCDMSMKPGYTTMAISCSYIKEGTVIVKHQYIYPPEESFKKNIYGELKAIIFALSNYKKYIGSCKSMVIYSDVFNIEKILIKEITFKKSKSLKIVQDELINLYKVSGNKINSKCIEIKYLTEELKRYNPFYKSAHNAARELFK
ncbi:hypothetical protein [Robertmurraya sp. P23]|uniref:hypothetical protein n=1 Tax=Robertmurraya sp. P23 TaxID=3436931 RepID=UPI003D986126